MRKKLSLLLAILLCLSLLPQAYASSVPFSDVPADHWAYDAIMETYNDGVMTGTAAGVFSPSGKLNMNQFFTVLTRAFYNDDVVNSTWDGAWPNQNLDAAEKHNLFNGIASWRGDMEVTREVMAQMMYNVMVDKNVVLPNAQELAGTLSGIPDSSSVDTAFQTAVATCYYWDLLSGTDANGSFAPKGLINRAQTAVIYTRLKKAVNVLSTGTPEQPGTTTPEISIPSTQEPPAGTENPTGATLTNGMPVTEENVLALMEEYRNGKEPGERTKANGFTSYMNHATYDPYNPPYTIMSFKSGTECAKFAFAFWDDLFGTDAPIREITDPMDLRAGDLIWYGSHWSIFIGFKFWELNGRDVFSVMSVDGGATGLIVWDDDCDTFSEIDRLKMDTFARAIYTRYPE